MLYPLNDILLLGLVMTLGSVIQGAIGFASGLLGVPLLVLLGFSLPEAAAINLVSTIVQNFTGAWQLWGHLEPRILVYPTFVRLLTVPLGTYAVWWIDQSITPDQIKQVVGMLLLVVIVLLWSFRVQPRERLNLFWQTLAFSTSGFLLGFASMGGAPLVIYVNSLTWTVSRARGFIFFCSAIGQPLAAWFFWRRFGTGFITSALSTIVVMPLILAGLWLGLHLGSRLSVPLFRRLTLGLITVTAVAAILQPLLFGR
jgi:uncharacterized protein